MNPAHFVAALLSVALVVGACGGNDDDTSNVTVPAETSTSTTSTTEATTTTTANPKAAVEQAFYDQWDAFVTILENPDPANPLIDQHFTGPARAALLDSVSDFLKEGKAARRPTSQADFSPGVVQIDVVSGAEAIVYECTVDGITVIDIKTGEVIDDDVETYSLRNEFTLDGGVWKLADTREPAEEEPGCAAA